MGACGEPAAVFEPLPASAQSWLHCDGFIGRWAALGAVAAARALLLGTACWALQEPTVCHGCVCVPASLCCCLVNVAWLASVACLCWREDPQLDAVKLAPKLSHLHRV